MCRDRKRGVQYSIITLNYDMVLENFVDFIQKNYSANEDIGFCEQNVASPASDGRILAKLHGSVDSGAIVPPTWAKGTHRKIAPVWKKAFEIIENSNQIRFIGYSLPVGDAYIKYLLKASVVNSPNLRMIDVICLDPRGEVRERYQEFIKFNFFRFKDATTEEYLEPIEKASNPSRPDIRGREHVFRIDGLEGSHERFMER